ncbi:MAG: hypothetical protein WC780_15900 [Lentimicrobiaceae bacterium]|jgi:hypothetical protein
MKKLLILLFTILLGTQQTFAQSSIKLESFRDKVLPQYNTYFNQAQLSENGQLNLTAVDKYILLPADSKKGIMLNITNAWRDSLVIVHYGSKSELWGWNMSTGARLLDEWDMALPPAALMSAAKAPDMILHPWFLYLGGQIMFDSQKNVNIAFNTRLGFFLLLNRWDLATSVSAGLSGNADAAGTPYSNIGVMTRVHFPIKKYGISPNIGGELTLASFGDTSPAFTPSLVLGLSWFVGFGRLDIGIKIGDITSGTGGYSMYPGLKSLK